ncbi:MAG: adenylyltransferase/cytidyltransferase family protein [Candidatus Micrarchaeota archaeon]
MAGKTKTVLVCGVFDLLHLGHLWFFRQAKKFGNHLTVLVARDSTVKKVKHRKPFFREKERMELLSSLKIVDEVVLGSRKNLFEGVKKAKPGVLVLGYDQLESVSRMLGVSKKISAKELKKLFSKKGLTIKIVRLNKGWMPERFKSSKVKVHLRVK